MTSFDNETNTEIIPGRCAEQVADAVCAVISAMRAEIRHHRPMDLSLPQFRALAYLYRHQQEEPSLSDIAEHLGLTPSTTSKLIDGLYQRHLLTRETAQDDRRRSILTLTEPGKAIFMEASRTMLARLDERFATLSDEQIAGINQVAQTLTTLFTPVRPHRKPCVLPE